jgi:hypothetical protein
MSIGPKGGRAAEPKQPLCMFYRTCDGPRLRIFSNAKQVGREQAKRSSGNFGVVWQFTAGTAHRLFRPTKIQSPSA